MRWSSNGPASTGRTSWRTGAWPKLTNHSGPSRPSSSAQEETVHGESRLGHSSPRLPARCVLCRWSPGDRRPGRPAPTSHRTPSTRRCDRRRRSTSPSHSSPAHSGVHLNLSAVLPVEAPGREVRSASFDAHYRAPCSVCDRRRVQLCALGNRPRLSREPGRPHRQAQSPADEPSSPAPSSTSARRRLPSIATPRPNWSGRCTCWMGRDPRVRPEGRACGRGR
jgi:hypothetical protein